MSVATSRATRWVLVAVLLAAVAGGAVALTVTGAGAPSDQPEASAPRPVVEDNRLVDARSGRELVLRGVTWSSFDYACAQGWGLSELDLLAGDAPEEVAATEAAALAAGGATTVRLPLNQDCWLGTRGAPVSDAHAERSPQDYRAAVTGFVDALTSAGLVVVLDLQSRKAVETPDSVDLTVPDSESLVFWSSVAGTFRDRASVLFEVLGSAVPGGWRCWRDGGCAVPGQGMDRVVRAVRDAGARQPVLLPGPAGSTDLRHWRALAPVDSQLVAVLHLQDGRADVVGLAEQVPVVGIAAGALMSLGRGPGAGLVPTGRPGGPFFTASTRNAWSEPSR